MWLGSPLNALTEHLGGGHVGLAELSLEDKKDTWAQFVFLSFKKKKKSPLEGYTPVC